LKSDIDKYSWVDIGSSYLPLHLSRMGKIFGCLSGLCPVTEDISNRIVRLPFYNDLNLEKLDFNIFFDYEKR